MHVLATASQQLGEKVYTDVQSQRSSPGGANSPQESRSSARDEDVIDADFREVKTRQ
jgi:molecular chaperone DnaK